MTLETAVALLKEDSLKSLTGLGLKPGSVAYQLRDLE